MARPRLPRTIVYVDGFNLYYGALKGKPHKWLDIASLAAKLLPNNDIVEIKYFTAIVNAWPSDPDQPVRQQLYLRALRTIPNLSIIQGRFLSMPKKMPRHPVTNPPSMVEVMKTEEKGSDVNLAAHLLVDGFRNRYDVAVLITNDSDLLEPIRLVRRELGKPVGILNPYPKPAADLGAACSFVKPIRAGALAASQFPAAMSDAVGLFQKPAGW